MSADLPVLLLGAGGAEVVGTEPYRVAQSLQVAVLTDFCNECGNCATFCPTAGVPYRDKPRLYLDRADFEAQDDNAFMLFHEGPVWSLESRMAGDTHRVDLNGSLAYSSPTATVRIDPETWEVLEASGEGRVSLRGAADMFALLEGLRSSAPHLPAANGGGARIAHPGYGE